MCVWDRLAAEDRRPQAGLVDLGLLVRTPGLVWADRNIGYARNVIRNREIEGDCFAKANLSAAETAAREDARISRTHEDRRRPQSFGGAPQEGTPSAHARVSRRVWNFPARRGWCGGENLMPCIAPANAARIPTSLFSFARTNCRKRGLDLASRRRWAAR